MQRPYRIAIGVGTISAAVLLGIGLAMVIGGYVLFFGQMLSMLDSMDRRGGAPDFPIAGFAMLMIGFFPLMLGSALNIGAMAFYAYHIAANDSISPQNRGLWSLATVLGQMFSVGTFVMVAYWWYAIWKAPYPEPAAPAASPAPAAPAAPAAPPAPAALPPNPVFESAE